MEDGTKATPIVYINCVDTLQYSFASHLSVEFRRKGISAFVNSKGTLDVIERASASVVVFSKNCLSSTSRLDKLVKVLQCQRKNGMVVLPVFYCISPSDVVILEHESSCSVDQISKWSSALQEMRELPGYQSREECIECESVEEIVKYVYEKLFPTEQIGSNSRLLEIEQLLCKQPWGIRRIGIWGMPGIGKTTLAKAIFNRISGRYEASCFIKHFDKAFHENGLHRLLEEHFGKIFKELPRVCSSITRPSLPGDSLSKKRTLVVLDDVQNPLVVQSFLGGFHWLGPGSLIIITSRDKQVFRLCQINHVYEVQSLNENEALQVFSHYAFGKDMREQNLLEMELSMEVVDYANGNPSVISFYGREFKGKKLSEMETTFLKFKQRMPYKIHDLFKSSYETLNDSEKNILLDIACFFKGEHVDYVMQLLEGCGFFPHVGIDVLVEKCLVTISEDRVEMNRIIQDFGREIINRDTVQIERRHRLWEPWTIKFLLESDELGENGDPKATFTRALGTEDIEGIFLDTTNLLFDVKPTAFNNMLSLRFLKIYCSSYEDISGLRLPKGLESLPYELRLLHWENYPLQSLPQDFDPCHLVKLDMPYSHLQKLWGGTKNLDMLKMVRLCHSQQLTEIDDICKAQNIELIDLQGCTKLQSFPATGQLQHLRVVNLSGCKEIKIFPEVSPNIEELDLEGTGIRELPTSVVTVSPQDKLNRELSNLLTKFSGVSYALNLEKFTSLVQVVSSNKHLSKLVVLNMKNCSHLQSLPHMVDLESLEILDLSGCSQLKDIQGFPRNLKELYLAGTAIEELPPLPWSIELLNAHGCVCLISIPFGFERLPKYYTFSNCFALSPQVVREFVVNALANVERMAREYKQEVNKYLAFSFCVPSLEKKKSTLDLQPGSSVVIRLGPSWRSTLMGFVILVDVAFSEDYHMAIGFSVRCVCRWKDKEGISHRLEKTLHCWTPEEGVPNIQKDHLFVLCDLNLHLSSGEGNDSDILADLVVFELFPVNEQENVLDGTCTVTKCGVYLISAADEDTSLNMTQQVSSLDHTKVRSDNEAEEELGDIYYGLDKREKKLFCYILCLFNDEVTDKLAQRIATIGLEISSGFKVLAHKSLIHISPYGLIVPPHVLLDSEIAHRSASSRLPHGLQISDKDFKKTLMISSSFHNRKWDNQTKMKEKIVYDILENRKHTPPKNSVELVEIDEDHVANMSALSSSTSEEEKKFGISIPSGKGEEINSIIVEPVEPLNGLKEQGKHYYTMWQTLFEIDTKYVPIKPIGGGSDGLVFSAISKETNKKVAIKMIHNVFENHSNAVRILREMNLHRHVKHINIIALNDVMLSGHKTSFKDVYMVYELMDSDLHQIIMSSQSLSDDHCKYFLFQLLRGLKYLHSVNILHRDLKPGNLLVNANCDLKISDFGLTRTSTCNDQFVIEYGVTHWYQAPELLLSCDKSETSVDIWSVGCIFAEILGGKPIFPGVEIRNQLKLIITVLGSQQESDLQFINNPIARRYIKSVPFSKGTHFSNLYPNANPLAIDLLQKMLMFDPTRRITVMEALFHPYLAELFDPNDNPPSQVLNPLKIDENMVEQRLREMMQNEMLYYHPETATSQNL